MRLDNILAGASFVCGLIGIAGLMGAIETGTGIFTASALCGIALTLGIWAGMESGFFWRVWRHRR